MATTQPLLDEPAGGNGNARRLSLNHVESPGPSATMPARRARAQLEVARRAACAPARAAPLSVAIALIDLLAVLLCWAGAFQFDLRQLFSDAESGWLDYRFAAGRVPALPSPRASAP